MNQNEDAIERARPREEERGGGGGGDGEKKIFSVYCEWV